MAEASASMELLNALKNFQEALDALPDGNDASAFQRWADHTQQAFHRFEARFNLQPPDVPQRRKRAGADVAPEMGKVRLPNRTAVKRARTEVEHLFDVVRSQILALTISRSEVAEGNSPEQAQELLEKSAELIAWIHDHEQELAPCAIELLPGEPAS